MMSELNIKTFQQKLEKGNVFGIICLFHIYNNIKVYYLPGKSPRC